MSDVGPGDRVRYREYEFTIARVDSPFLGVETMVCLIEDEPTRWFAYPGPAMARSKCCGRREHRAGTRVTSDRRRHHPLLPARQRPAVVLAHGALDDGRCWTASPKRWNPSTT